MDGLKIEIYTGKYQKASKKSIKQIKLDLTTHLKELSINILYKATHNEAPLW